MCGRVGSARARKGASSVLVRMAPGPGAGLCRRPASGQGSAADRGQQAIDLTHEILKVKWFRQHARIARHWMIGIERDRGEAGYEHDFELGVELSRTPRQLDAVH